ncbi:flagellar hook-length control protein FliK [Photobacterium damselae]|uniref:flagellar hook-length control protein FliK n=1 Tax=Photobacterium damselae TaxID=38293 RepID=UPI001EDEA0A1|nr:flagellar hook-length control protein FliK [Photobacterium damselae]MCG3843872.1 flagellar hook-length control protein FliK [Photobacterium damselae]
MQLSHLLSQVNAKSHAGATATTRNEPTGPTNRGEEAQFSASLHSAMDDTSDTQLKTKSQLKSELGSEEALKKESSKDDVSSDELSIEGLDPSVALLDENAVMKSTANDDSQALFAQNEVGEKPQTSPQSVSPSSTEESSDSQKVAQSMDEGFDVLQQLQQSHGQLRSKEVLTDQQDAELGTESVSTDADTDTMIASMSMPIINASGDNASQAGKLTSTDETELKHHRHIDTELDLRELKTTISSGKESSKELLESQQNKSVHGQNLLLASKAELLPQGDAVKASLNHSAALSQAQTQSLLDQSHTADNKEASAQAALQSLSAHHNGTSTASSLLGNRQDTSLNNQPPLLLTKEQAGDQLADKVQMMAAKNLKQIDIRLDPPELGRMQIKLSLHDDNQASIQFQVAHQQTRDLIDQAMPRLRELLLQQGMQLAQSSVHQESSQQFSHHFNQQNGQDSSGFGAGGHSDGSHDGHDNGTVIEGYVTTSSDRVDFYA